MIAKKSKFLFSGEKQDVTGGEQLGPKVASVRNMAPFSPLFVILVIE